MKTFISFLKWALGIFVILLAVFTVVLWWYVRSEEKQLSGENTEVVDPAQFEPIYGELAIINVGVLSVDIDSILPGRTILIKDDIIEEVGEDIEIPPGYSVLDGKDKYLIPGLIDTHIHPYRSQNDLLLFIANGITHVATMSSWRGLYLEWRDQAKNGALMPQIYVAAGPMNSAHDFRSKVYGSLGPIQLFNDPEATKKDVSDFKEMGYDALKAYSLDKENYFAVSEASQKHNIPMVGHVTPAVTLDDLYRSNQSQVAHVEEITKAVEREFGGRSKIYYDSTEEYLSFLKERADTIAKRLKENNITVSTTIDVYPRAKEQDLNLIEYLKSIEIEYINPGILEGSVFNPGWFPGSNRYENPYNTDPEGIRKSNIYWDTYIEAVNIMTLALVRNGVAITAGTDAGNPGIVPGFSLHDELECLSKIGLSNEVVLNSATAAAAKWIGSNAGKIEVGRQADLVLLDGNPLEDIRNTRKINAVVVKGKYTDRDQLDEMLLSIKEANNRSRKISIEKYLEE